MPQVSKRFIKKEKLNKMFTLFFDLVANVDDKNKAEQIIDELLTPTEKIMIAKRIACFYLISKKVPPPLISDAIKLSSSTIGHYYYLYEHSNSIKKFVQEKLATEKITNILKNVLVEVWYGIPKKGADWSYQKRQYLRHKKQMEEPI